ncbi:hypothetical protein PG994_001884, partial [Apiospora phragmitis]
CNQLFLFLFFKSQTPSRKFLHSTLRLPWEDQRKPSLRGARKPLPPYTEGKDSKALPRPSSAISAAAPQLQPTATTPYRQFPAAFNLYHQKSRSGRSLVYTLGEHESEPLYTLTIHSGISGNPSLVLHNGPDPGRPPSPRRQGARPGDFRQQAHGQGLAHHPARPAQLRPPHRRGAPRDPPLGAITAGGGDDGTGNDNEDDKAANQWTRERFEWRHSRGNEVKQLDRLNSGWKLVRIHSEADGVGGTRRARDAGASSDGKELVAVFAEVSGWSTSKVVKFKFLGSGATGEMGPRWSLMAVMTALRIWDTQNGLSESAAATAAGAASGGHSRSASKAAAAAAGGASPPTTGAPGGAATGGSEKFT